MATESFPPLNHLGYGLDLTTINPMGVDGVVNSLKKFAAIVDIDPDDRPKEHTIGGVKYKIPRLVSATEDIKSAAASLQTYTSGSKASEAFNLNASLSVTYGAISGSASATYGYNKTFKEDTMFALYSASHNAYRASLGNFGGQLNEDRLMIGLATLPLLFDGNNKEHVDRLSCLYHLRNLQNTGGANKCIISLSFFLLRFNMYDLWPIKFLTSVVAIMCEAVTCLIPESFEDFFESLVLSTC